MSGSSPPAHRSDGVVAGVLPHGHAIAAITQSGPLRKSLRTDALLPH